MHQITLVLCTIALAMTPQLHAQGGGSDERRIAMASPGEAETTWAGGRPAGLAETWWPAEWPAPSRPALAPPRVQVGGGPSGWGAVEGAIFGAVGGGVLAGVIRSASTGGQDQGGDALTAREASGIGAAVGAGLGAIIGALFGGS